MMLARKSSSSFWGFPLSLKNCSRKNSAESSKEVYIQPGPITPELHEAIYFKPSFSPCESWDLQSTNTLSTKSNPQFVPGLAEMDCFQNMESFSPILYQTPLFNACEIVTGLPLESIQPLEVRKRATISIQPLSNFPTPPPEDEQSEWGFEAGFPCVTMEHMRDPELIGRAKYLIDFIPRNCSQDSPRSWMILSILVRAEHLMQIEVIALAGCVLDSLSTNFASKWRQEIYQTCGINERPEVLPIVALIIAVKFLNDRAPTNAFWSDEILDERFSLWPLNITERLMLQDNDYCLSFLSTPKAIASSVRKIRSLISKEREVQSRFTEQLSPISDYKSRKSSTSTRFSMLTDDEEDGYDHDFIDYAYGTSDDEEHIVDEDAEFEDDDNSVDLSGLILLENKHPTPDFHSMAMNARVKSEIYPVSAGLHSKMQSFPDLGVRVAT